MVNWGSMEYLRSWVPIAGIREDKMGIWVTLGQLAASFKSGIAFRAIIGRRIWNSSSG